MSANDLSSLSSLRYLVFADRNRRRLLAAFADLGDARHYLHLHCPCSGEVVEVGCREEAGQNEEEHAHLHR